METLLDLVEPMLFTVDPQPAVVPLNKAAVQCLAALGGADALPALFGCDSFATLYEAAISGTSRTVTLAFGGDKQSDVKWDFVDAHDGSGALLAVGVNWMPADALADRVAKETLIYKRLLLNILPRFIVDTLLDRKAVQPKAYRESTIVFIDTVDFSRIAQVLDPVSLLKQLDYYFSMFDRIMSAHGVEKIKTIGDAYMAASGIPHRKASHAVDATLAALQIRADVEGAARESRPPSVHTAAGGDVSTENWRFRIGLHSGPCISGVLGSSKHMFDIWGDAVRVAADVEAVGAPDRVTVSDDTRALLEPWFVCAPAGETRPHNGAVAKVHTVERLRAEYSADAAGTEPNEAFARRYASEFHAGVAKGSVAPPPPFVASLMGNKGR